MPVLWDLLGSPSPQQGGKRTLDFEVGYFLSRVLHPKEARLKVMMDMVALLFAVVIPWLMPKNAHMPKCMVPR